MLKMPRSPRYGGLRLLVHLAALLAMASAAPAMAKPLVWAFGDSLTAGYGLPPAQGFTAVLQARLRTLGVDVTVANGGVAGETTAQGLARLRWGLRGLGRQPDLVIVEFGANDMLRGLPVAQARTNLDAILVELRRRRIPVLLAGMRAAPNLGRDYVRAFDGMYPTLAHAHRIPLYPFFLDGVAGRRGMVQPDGLHPDARGVQAIVTRMAPLVRATLAKGRA